MAAPFGPPPVSATTSFAPLGRTRVSVPRLTSTTSTLPSSMATGPSGNSSPEVISRIFGILLSPFSLLRVTKSAEPLKGRLPGLHRKRALAVCHLEQLHYISVGIPSIRRSEASPGHLRWTVKDHSSRLQPLIL